MNARAGEIWGWPALELGQSPRRLEVERAVWGKVHGATSDFRWIARSPGIDPQSRRLERELLLGFEDSPGRACCWRALGGSFCAISCYPSRAMDAARRSGFLEKQILEWKPPAGAPAVLGALLLLPQVARFTDEEWWKHSADAGWSLPGFAMVLKPGDALPIEVTESELQRNADAGLRDLREAVGDESALAELYSALLTGQRPTILAGLRGPLKPEGVAALLLPLPRSLADRLSVAGWLLSKRVDAESFRHLWDVLICDTPPAALRSSSAIAVTEQGGEAARAVFTGDPSRLVSRPRSAAAKVPVSRLQLPSAIERLQDFATDDGRRWLAPEELDGPFQTAEGYEGSLKECAESLEAEIQGLDGASSALHWRREHLQVKADLLRAAAVALVPAAFWRLGPPKSCRVPALFYCPRLAERDWGLDLDEDKLGEIVCQSLDCRPDLFGRAIRAWLEGWGQRNRITWLKPLLDSTRPQ